jgi:hypothetical protein
MADVAIEAGDATDAGNGEGDAAGATWVDAPAAGGVMAGVLASFSEHGFDLGYRRAVSDAIALLMLTAAEQRREVGDDPRARAALAEFVNRLDRQLQRLSSTAADEVYGGLGI